MSQRDHDAPTVPSSGLTHYAAHLKELHEPGHDSTQTTSKSKLTRKPAALTSIRCQPGSSRVRVPATRVCSIYSAANNVRHPLPSAGHPRATTETRNVNKRGVVADSARETLTCSVTTASPAICRRILLEAKATQRSSSRAFLSILESNNKNRCHSFRGKPK